MWDKVNERYPVVHILTMNPCNPTTGEPLNPSGPKTNIGGSLETVVRHCSRDGAHPGSHTSLSSGQTVPCKEPSPHWTGFCLATRMRQQSRTHPPNTPALAPCRGAAVHSYMPQGQIPLPTAAVAMDCRWVRHRGMPMLPGCLPMAAPRESNPSSLVAGPLLPPPEHFAGHGSPYPCIPQPASR